MGWTSATPFLYDVQNMLYYASQGTVLSDEDLQKGLEEALENIQKERNISRVLAIPPDITRVHSRAGDITCRLRRLLGDRLQDILPAIGTHYPMTDNEIDTMFPALDHGLFRRHSWKSDLSLLGRVPADYLQEVSGGLLDYDWPVQVNKLLVEGGFDLIFSIGQVVPHEVIGFANHNKNVLIGTGGAEGIHRSHFLGAVCDMERIMGRADTPVRRVLNYASDHFAGELPIVYVLTVLSPDEKGELLLRGLFIGSGYECFERAAALSREVNLTLLDRELTRTVVYLNPQEFRSTWLGNKAIYRTRMAMADGGELIIIAPGVREFGEDSDIDALIRRFGYRGRKRILELLPEHEELRNKLSAAAHLIHGSSEDRFSISYAPGGLTKREVESVGYTFLDLEQTGRRFEIENKQTGFHRDANGEEFFFIRNPALGLWAYRSRFESE